MSVYTHTQSRHLTNSFSIIQIITIWSLFHTHICTHECMDSETHIERVEETRVPGESHIPLVFPILLFAVQIFLDRAECVCVYLINRNEPKNVL